MINIQYPQPEAIIRHLIDQVNKREIQMPDLQQLYAWIKTNPKVFEHQWFKRFPNFILVGDGQLVKTVLKSSSAPIGVEIK